MDGKDIAEISYKNGYNDGICSAIAVIGNLDTKISECYIESDRMKVELVHSLLDGILDGLYKLTE